MLSKYLLIGAGGVIGILAITVVFQYFKIQSLEEDLESSKKDVAICQLSQINLTSQVERQNKLIKEFKSNLDNKNQALKTIETKNKILQKNLQKKINEINQVQNETCEDSINWMLEEAIGNHENIGTNSGTTD